MVKLGGMRKEYQQKSLSRKELNSDPFIQFDQWFQEAVSSGIKEANAVVLATVSPNGQPSARIMLLKHYDDNGFVLFTNYRSQKAQDIQANPKASLLFWWKEQIRQVRIEGQVEMASQALSDQYFAHRDRQANIGAYASKQSGVIPNRQHLIDRYQQVTQKYQDVDPLPRPDFWGGYVLAPTAFEFWSGAENRLHDRFRYRMDDQGKWVIARLAP